MRAAPAKLLLALIAASLSFAGAHAQASRETTARAAWGFDRSDLWPHPEVRFGVLANGMRYALMRNAASPGGLSVRLRIDAGSRDEGAREQGFLHLIEHLIFHGSANLPRGALPLMLRHQGLARWSDFNAYTSYDETVYRLDLSKADRGSRDTALMLMREISTNLVFKRKAVEGAKAMVRAEIGERDAVQDRISTAQNAFFVPGTPIARGPVAGTGASVAHARGAALRRLYERSYVPGHATLVFVGDFDPAAAEAEIVARFSDWRPGAASRADRTPSTIRSDRGAEARLFVDPAAPTAVTIATVAPLGGPDAAPRRDAVFLEHLGAEMLNRRLARIAAQPGAPFAGGGSAIYDHFSTARIAQVEVAANIRDWRGAIQAGARELGVTLRDGFSQSELDAQLAASRRALAAAETPRTRSAVADAIVDAAGRGIVFTAPTDRSANDNYLARVRLAEINAAFRAAWAGRTRLIFVSHNRPIPNAEAAIAAVWAESSRLNQISRGAR